MPSEDKNITPRKRSDSTAGEGREESGNQHADLTARAQRVAGGKKEEDLDSSDGTDPAKHDEQIRRAIEAAATSQRAAVRGRQAGEPPKPPYRHKHSPRFSSPLGLSTTIDYEARRVTQMNANAYPGWKRRNIEIIRIAQGTPEAPATMAQMGNFGKNVQARVTSTPVVEAYTSPLQRVSSTQTNHPRPASGAPTEEQNSNENTTTPDTLQGDRQGSPGNAGASTRRGPASPSVVELWDTAYKGTDSDAIPTDAVESADWSVHDKKINQTLITFSVDTNGQDSASADAHLVESFRQRLLMMTDDKYLDKTERYRHIQLRTEFEPTIQYVSAPKTSSYFSGIPIRSTDARGFMNIAKELASGPDKLANLIGNRRIAGTDGWNVWATNGLRCILVWIPEVRKNVFEHPEASSAIARIMKDLNIRFYVEWEYSDGAVTPVRVLANGLAWTRILVAAGSDDDFVHGVLRLLRENTGVFMFYDPEKTLQETIEESLGK